MGGGRLREVVAMRELTVFDSQELVDELGLGDKGNWESAYVKKI